MVIRGRIVQGCGHFRVRMTEYPDVFTKATGQKPFPGTLNVKIDQPISVREDFRIKGADIGEPEQDLVFECCRINGLEAFRIRPLHLATGLGGHGDDTLEITYSQMISCADPGTEVEIEVFR